MPSCPQCRLDVAAPAEVCPRCATPLPPDVDETRLADSASASVGTGEDATGSSPPASRPRHPVEPGGVRVPYTGTPATRRSSGSPISTSWLTSTDAIDHGRFAPGTLLDGRYRIVGRLGRGGMGEVFRADDLKLGQPVALKFLPEAVDTDPARLTQLHMEVRMARQVSHPNVCRVYDVGDVEGHTFLSMEYVDGEDLASLLRRIGRFPQDRAIELARQICAGLAAAHDRGVVHRDLKPANIMLDGNGRIRITDFGLAGAAGESLRAGTPAYMSPEQLGGGEVTPRSDVYAVGLVLYELFTGRRALDGRNLAELIAKREQAAITPPSEVVRDLDPAIERAIMRCLEPDPLRRPASALAVAAALPGGDPLAAALAAGETPSPAMVAAAGSTSALRPLAAVSALAVALAALVISGLASDRLLLTSIAPLPKPAVLLSERAKDILRGVGYAPDAADSAQGFGMPDGVSEYLHQHPESATAGRFSAGTPPAVQFWRRTSPAVMVPFGTDENVTLTNPPLVMSGMTLVKVDAEGRLLQLAVVPPQVDPQPKPAEVDWQPLFEAAGLNMTAFTSATPQWTPRVYADTRAAWTGPLPGVPDQQLRIEAAAYGGRPVVFELIGPWTRPTRTAEVGAESTRVSFASAAITLTIFSMFVAAALIARHNLRKGRGDRRGGYHLAAFVSALAFIVWLIDGTHFANPSLEMQRFFVGQPLWAAGLLWLLYLAIEPYVRRFWPTTLVSWSRLMAGQWRDPLVGRDILFAVAISASIHVLYQAQSLALARMGHPAPPEVPDLRQLLGTHVVLARVLNHVFNAVLNALLAVFGMVLLKILVRREGLAVALAIGVALLASLDDTLDSGMPAVAVPVAVLVIAIIVLTIQRLGLLATMTLSFATFILSTGVMTFDPSRWFFGNSVLLLLIPAGLACYGFYASRGDEPLFGRRLLD